PLILIVLFGISAISILSYQYSPSIGKRVDRTLLLFSGERKQIDLALSFRLPIWEGAAAMITAHPINGVGVRNFRYAYPEVALPDDLFLTQHKVSPHHPHQLILELFSETGIFGLLGLITLYYLLIQAWIKSTSAQKKLAIPAAVALLAALFPINTHLALFSSFWGQIIWWLIALYVALINIPSEPADTD
ncbi:MAG: O-antigen ligase family protein, partial [Gammaproteobacteria bacterium]|nr:O-antigen ligase family protein [Gammaproteobacteria bacterium]